MRYRQLGLMALMGAAAFAVAGGPTNVSYVKQVQPFLTKKCSGCHVSDARGAAAGGLDTTSHAALMKGGRFGMLVKPGDAYTSARNVLFRGRVDRAMASAHGRKLLSTHEIAIFKVWACEGAKNN